MCYERRRAEACVDESNAAHGVWKFRGRKWNIFVNLEPLLFREIVPRPFSLVEGGSLVGAVGGGRRSAGGG
jgi:hypothetical protein